MLKEMVITGINYRNGFWYIDTKHSLDKVVEQISCTSVSTFNANGKLVKTPSLKIGDVILDV
jgi:hypothetical protein